MDLEDVLSAYVEDYFEVVSGLSYDDLAHRQKGFHASLAFGAAGIAYACWHAAALLGEPDLLEEAERWLAATRGRERDRLSFLVPKSELAERPPSHYLFGEAGLVFVQALVSHARKDEPGYGAAVARFCELGRASQAGSPELYNGAAGVLAGTAILAAYTSDPRLRQLGEELAAGLAARALPADGALLLWPELRGLGLSHGSAGPYLALLLASAACGSPLPEGYAPALENLLDLALGSPSRVCPGESHHAMLCNGFSGLVYLAARAHRTLGGERFLEAARRAARLAFARTSDLPDLCCGRTGAAYSCLALSREDPQGPWKEQATDLALSTLLSERESWPTVGLYTGEAAVACLCASLLTGLAPGLPGLDLVEFSG